MYRNLLWMSDLSERADQCLDPVVALAKLSRGEVLLAHATGLPPKLLRERPLSPDSASRPVELERNRRARTHLEGVQARLAEAGVSARIFVVEGLPEDVGEELCKAHKVDLVVAGRTGVTGIDRLLLGSTSTRLVRGMPVPTLVVGPRPFTSLRRLLCPLDLEEPRHDAAILHAATLARAADAQVDYLSVIEAGSGLEDPEAAEARICQRVERALGASLPTHARAVALIDETAVHGILRLASQVDLIVMSSAGRSGLSRLIAGSTAEDVVKKCPVSVLVAH